VKSFPDEKFGCCCPDMRGIRALENEGCIPGMMWWI
jgi:hypothetical protein